MERGVGARVERGVGARAGAAGRAHEPPTHSKKDPMSRHLRIRTAGFWKGARTGKYCIGDPFHIGEHPSCRRNLFIAESHDCKGQYGLFTSECIEEGEWIGFYGDVSITDDLDTYLHPCKVIDTYGQKVNIKKSKYTMLCLRHCLQCPVDDVLHGATYMGFANEAPVEGGVDPSLQPHNNMVKQHVKQRDGTDVSVLLAARRIDAHEELYHYYGSDYDRQWSFDASIMGRNGNSSLPIHAVRECNFIPFTSTYSVSSPINCMEDFDASRSSFGLPLWRVRGIDYYLTLEHFHELPYEARGYVLPSSFPRQMKRAKQRVEFERRRYAPHPSEDDVPMDLYAGGRVLSAHFVESHHGTSLATFKFVDKRGRSNLWNQVDCRESICADAEWVTKDDVDD